MNLLQRFQHHIKKEDLFHPKDRLLLAVSGGVDSIVLCQLCSDAGYVFDIAHSNFQLRGEESDVDEEFVSQLAQKYSCRYFTKKFHTENYAAANRLSIQTAARQLRYSWFKEIVAQEAAHPLKYILTAHHADDNMETILMNFFKGSGIKGLKGILPKQNTIVRPLLFARKEELLDFARNNNLHFREDASNNSDKYTRNYFRNQLIPDLEKVYPGVSANIIANSTRFRDINILYRSSVDAILKKLLHVQGNEVHVPVLKLLKTPAFNTILYEMTRPYGFSPKQVDELHKLLYAESGKYIQSDTHRILRNRAWLIIAPIHVKDLGHYIIEQDQSKLSFKSGEIAIDKILNNNLKLSTDEYVAMTDLSQIEFPLILRKWKTGDYFYPLGMQKKKKLSRFFIDKKLSKNEKEDTWVIESDKKLVWILGHRIDDRFKVTGRTTHICTFSFLPAK